jgi:hypothetical protein
MRILTKCAVPRHGPGYDDTSIIMHEIGEHGAGSRRGGRAIERLNAIHAQFPIKNADFLYVLWVFCYEPQRWIDRGWAWRHLHPEEREALFLFWVDVGKRMEIQDLPSTDEEFRMLGASVESRCWKSAPQNRVVTAQLLDLVVSWGPRFVPSQLKRRFVSLAIGSVGSSQLLAAIGQSQAPLPIRLVVHGLLWFCGWLGAMLPPRRRKFARTTLLPQCPVRSSTAAQAQGSDAFRASAEYTSYCRAGSYTFEQLGPTNMHALIEATEREKRQARSSVHQSKRKTA